MRRKKVDHDETARPGRPSSLKELAAYLNLSTTTLSLVLNNSPAAESIPAATKRRILSAAREFNYRPNYLARSLRAQRSYAIGVMLPELSEGYSSLVLSGIDDRLMTAGYMCLATSHRHAQNLVEQLPRLLCDRRVDGLIVVDTPYALDVPLPIVSVSGHRTDKGVTNVILNHDLAAELALRHLKDLGHTDIAVMKGQSFSSDTAVRWDAIQSAASRLGLHIATESVVELEEDSPSPATGYRAAQKLLERKAAITALLAFNDVSAFGAIRAFQETGLRVPEDVSVVGFDDIWGAAFHIPALTTIRQPLRDMGTLAASTLLERLGSRSADYPPTIEVEPELVIRESSGRAKRRVTT